MADFSAPTSQSGVGVGNAVAMGLFGNDGENEGGDLFSAGGQADLFGGEPVLSGPGDVSDVNFASGIAPVVGTIADIGKLTATPPPRPPPPATGPNGTPRAVSPAVGGASPGRPNPSANKSAFDDLNDSIRMALGGSPSRPSPAVQQSSQQPQQPASQIIQQQSQQGFVAFDAGTNMAMPAGAGQTIINTVPGYVVPPTQVPVGYGSPVKQPIAGDGN